MLPPFIVFSSERFISSCSEKLLKLFQECYGFPFESFELKAMFQRTFGKKVNLPLRRPIDSRMQDKAIVSKSEQSIPPFLFPCGLACPFKEGTSLFRNCRPLNPSTRIDSLSRQLMLTCSEIKWRTIYVAHAFRLNVSFSFFDLSHQRFVTFKISKLLHFR